MPSMKAVRIHAYGGADVLAYEDAPRPTAGDGEVLIRVHAASVNPFDCAVRAGYMSAYLNYTLPVILGVDVSPYFCSNRSQIYRLNSNGSHFYLHSGGFLSFLVI